LSTEDETKKLLEFREKIERKIIELETEINDLQKALEEIDNVIVKSGFRTFTTADTLAKKIPPMDSSAVSSSEQDDLMNLTSKDGTILGNIDVEKGQIEFTPSEIFGFTTDIPPFQSFFIERVLENMRKTDQERATNGEIDPSEILEYKIMDDEGKIKTINITNYRGERRLREINSSLRWTLDKMYEKLTQG
jgi:hypothetical protein